MTEALALLLIGFLLFRCEFRWIYNGKAHTLILNPKEKDMQP